MWIPELFKSRALMNWFLKDLIYQLMRTVLPEEKMSLLCFFKSSQSTLCAIRNLFHIPNSVNCRCKFIQNGHWYTKEMLVTVLWLHCLPLKVTIHPRPQDQTKKRTERAMGVTITTDTKTTNFRSVAAFSPSFWLCSEVYMVGAWTNEPFVA